MSVTEPLLHERASRREDEVRQTDTRCKQCKDLQHRIAFTARLPGIIRSYRQERQRYGEQNEVDDCLRTWFEGTGKKMRIGVAAQQQDLEEEHAGRPDTGATAKPWQDVLSDEWLDLKQEKSASEDRKRPARLANPNDAARLGRDSELGWHCRFVKGSRAPRQI